MGKNKDFSENINDFKEFLERLRGLTNPLISNFENNVMFIPQLEDKILDLNGYEDFKIKLKESEELLLKYQSDFLNISLLEEIDFIIKDILNSYNNEYKVRHDSYYEEFTQLKDNFLLQMNTKLEAIKALRKLNFKNISSIDEFTIKLEDYTPCNVVISEGIVTACKVCDKRDLKKLEGKKEALKDLFLKHKKIINGIFESYIDSLSEDSIKDKLINNDNYKNILFAAHRISNEETNGNEIRDIKENIEYVENEINIIINTETKIEKNIDFNEITNELLLELQGTGQKYLSLEEVKNRFVTIIDKYKEKEILNTKI